MMKKFTEPEKKVLGILQRDLPVVSRPFDEAAAMCGLSVAQLFDLLKTLKTEGVMRRFGAALRHQKAGYTRNALVVWSVGPQEIETAGRICAQAPSISHCYERRPPFLGKYDLLRCCTRKATIFPRSSLNYHWLSTAVISWSWKACRS